MSFFEELKRRNVFRVAIGYVITAWLLLQVVDLVLENINTPDWVMQVFMLALAIGFPLAVFFAWAFEMTPEGVKREAEVDRSKSIAKTTGRKMDRNIIIAMALALAYFAYDKFSSSETDSPSQVAAPSAEVVTNPPSTTAPQASQTDDKSIAVLPLINRSVNAEDAFFAEGLHDELLTQLSRISALRVISRTSVMGYAGTTKRIPEIAAELGVTSLLEGGVQRSGNRVRINVQLIDAVTDEHLWAEVYDRELTADNLFDIQSDITQAIANALHAVLTGEEQQTLEQKPTENFEAYAYYLRGKATAQGYGRTIPQIDQSIASYQAAIDLDPDFAAAYASLSIDWAERYWNSDKQGDDMLHSLDALQRAQALAPESADTLTAEGYYHYWGFLDYAPAIASFERVLDREPGNTLALRGRAYVLRRMGRLDKAITDMERIVSLDPLVAEMAADAGYTLARLGQFERAEAILNRAFTLAPEKLFVNSSRTELFLMKADLESARQSVGPIDADSQGYYYDQRFLIARAQSDDVLIDQVLDTYPESDLSGLGQEFTRGLVLSERGEHDKLRDLVSDMEAATQNQPDNEYNLLYRVSLYALQKDQARLTGAVKAFYAGVKPDAMRIIDNRIIPTAYAIAGDSEALLAYLEDMVEQFGPWEFYYFALDPSFNNMRDLPRFQALDRRYRQWLEQVQ